MEPARSPCREALLSGTGAWFTHSSSSFGSALWDSKNMNHRKELRKSLWVGLGLVVLDGFSMACRILESSAAGWRSGGALNPKP